MKVYSVLYHNIAALENPLSRQDRSCWVGQGNRFVLVVQAPFVLSLTLLCHVHLGRLLLRLGHL